MASIPVVYADDPDAAWSWQVTDDNGNNLDFTPTVAIGPGAYTVTATWQGAAAPTRWLKVPLTGLAGGKRYSVYLRVPGGVDFRLGSVFVKTRD